MTLSNFLRNYCHGWVGGWLENLRIRLTSASVEVEVELSRVEAELGKRVIYV